MVQYNLTVDDISPLISYEGNWESLTMNHPGDEAAIQSFSGNTLHVLNSTGSATLQFAGRAISVWGPRRLDSSGYTVLLDGAVVDPVGLGTGSNESVLLYSVGGLAPGLPHTLEILNAPLDPQRSWLRIDKFVVESGTDGGHIIETVINDSDRSIQYHPNSRQWSNESEDPSAYLGGTVHAINMATAFFQFTTEGDSVEIYGGQDSNFSSFTVTVDGSQRTFTPNVSDFHAPVLLFQTEFLQPNDKHTIQVKTLEDKPFEFDFVRIVNYGDNLESTDGTSPPSVGNTNPDTQTKLPSSAMRLSGPAIAGIVLGCLAILALVSLGLLWYRKTRRRKVPPSAAFLSRVSRGQPQRNIPIYEEFSSVYHSQSTGIGEQRPMDLLDGQPGLESVERSNYDPFLSMYKTGAVRSTYEATLRPEDSASLRVQSPPASEVGSRFQSDHITNFTPTISAALPPLPERYSASH